MITNSPIFLLVHLKIVTKNTPHPLSLWILSFTKIYCLLLYGERKKSPNIKRLANNPRIASVKGMALG